MKKTGKQPFINHKAVRICGMMLMIFVFSSVRIQAQTPQVLKDIYGQSTNHSQAATGYNFKGFNGYVYFSAEDGLNGFELWKTNGTETGTVMLKDINPGSASSIPSGFIEMNGALFFAATSAANGHELWKTDGTEAGTVMVKDINTTTSSSNPQNFFLVNGTLFFIATTSSGGQELWKSDGTETGTVMVKDINPGTASSSPGNFYNLNGQLIFRATTAANGAELWRSDGTTAGTILLKDINAGITSTTILRQTVSGSFLFFNAGDTNGNELWRTDGTEAGTIMIKDINPGSLSGSPDLLTPLGSIVYFTANDGVNGNELWKTDGTPAGTVLVKDINAGALNSYPDLLTPAGSLLYFVADNDTLSYELWRTDGTAAGTFFVKDIFPGTGLGSFPGNLTAVGDTLFFSASDVNDDLELWRTNGTEATTVLVKDINPGISNSNPQSLRNVNGTLFFTAQTNTTGRELWKSDGTEAGTILLKDLNPGATASSPTNITVVNNTLFFTATISSKLSLAKSDGTVAGTVALNPTVVSGGSYATLYGFENKLYFMHDGLVSGEPSTATGREPWVSDGTNAGTALIKDINITTSGSIPGPYGRMGNIVFFTATDGVNGAELWKTDGTAAGTILVKDIATGATSSNPANFVYANNIMFFTAATSTTGTELWKTDGTTAGTVLVKDIRAGATTSAPTLLTAADNLLFLVANDGTTGNELWKSDGTTAGTVLVADIIAGTGSPSIAKPTNVNGTLFFTATLTASGTELWKSDGTAGGTVLVKDIIVGTGSPGIDDLIAYNGKLYFSASDGVNGNEPWVSDGTPAGTIMFVNIHPTANSNPTNFAVANNFLYFTAFQSATQFEPWISDGTTGGTYMITEIVPGGSGSVPFGFTYMNGFVYFNANATGTGRELWRTDNTAIGTTLVKDINTGSGDGSPEQLTVVNSTLFFRATMPGGGVEFFKSDGTESGTVGYDLYPGTTASTPDYLTALNDKLVFSATHQVLNREIWKIDVAPPSSFTIVGDTTPCVGGTAVYSAAGIINNGYTYTWTLPSGGGTIISAADTVVVQWDTAGTRSVQLVLSNIAGSSAPKQRSLVVSGTVPPRVPVIFNFARNLSVDSVLQSASLQWFRNDTVINGATGSSYYAGLAGSYTIKYRNNCGYGPASNAFNFPADVQIQTINFPHVADISMSPVANAPLPATASSGLPVFYQKISGPGTIINDTLFVSATGTVIIKAMQPGDDVYSAATPKYDTIIVIKGNQVIDFPPIADRMFRSGSFTINPVSSIGLPVTKTIVSGNASISGSTISLTGAGNITVRATQAGNSNYNAAPPVDRTFCVGVDTLSAIVGAATVCLNTYTYRVQKIPGANYVWTLSGGGTMTTNADTAFVTWQTAGTHTLKVKANSSCNATYSFEPQKNITIGNSVPTPVSYMLPENNAQNQSLPLTLSWIPGVNTETYDLYVWDSTTAQPGTPYKTNITGISYTVPQLAFAYNTTYKWRLVSKNPCNQVSGPIQTFRLIPLPDLEVTSVVAPTSAISGQTISVSWTVKNNGPGNTPTGAVWKDAVYLTFDTLPNFTIAPEVTSYVWALTNFPVRALLLGTNTNVSALQSGQQYTNSVNFTIPINYSFPLYAYVITNSGTYSNAIIEVTRANDTAHSANPMNITLAPTPDLRVDSMFTSASTFSGSTVNVSYKVKNYGSLTPAGASWQDVAYLSQSSLFDSANAIKLSRPKTNGSYYPNTSFAGTSVNTQLQHDSAYYRNFDVVIPNYIFGTWFLHVKTNNTASLYEGPAFNNNTNNNPVQVYLTPTPKLTVSSVTLPVTQASITQPIGLNWNIYNDGFRDNIEKNRGHYITMGTCQMPCPPGSPANSICYGPAVIRDSIAFGSSYWLDRVYLSADSSGLNLSNAVLLKETTHGTLHSGLYTERQPDYISCPAVVGGNINVSNIINPGSDFPATVNFSIPSNLQAGNYYIYVWANAAKNVFEYPGTPQIKRTGAITIQRPDAVVSSISSPANAVAGQQIAIGYSISNNGPGAVFNHIRRDSIYISTSAVFNASAVLIGTNIFTEDLPVGTAVPHSFNYTLHPSQSGTRYFYVRTNIDSAFRETNYANNISTASATVFAPASPVDLVVSAIQTTDTVVTVFPTNISYTVVNNGSGAASGTWTDSLFVSCNSVYSQSTVYYIGKKQQTRTIAAGASVTDTFNIGVPFTYNINSCFTQYNFNNGYFFIKTNADGGVYEGANANNNTSGTGVKVLDNPLVDHIITQVTGADSATVGHPYTVAWTVKNIGRNPIIDYDSRWDSIYVSIDSVLNSNAVGMRRLKWTNKLNHDQTKALDELFNFTNVPSGYYYILVKDNATNQIAAEKNHTNNVNLIRDNNNAAKKIWVTRPLLPDLTDSVLSAPLLIATGQPATIIHRITNNGASATYPNSFVHRIRLTNDPSGGTTYANLSGKILNKVLQPGQHIDDTVQVLIPTNLAPRIYTLYSHTDSDGAIAETDETNNVGISFINVYQPDPSDLIVFNATTPDTVMLGYKMDSARWVIKNNSGVGISGYSSDGIYLSPSNSFDSSATLIGIKTRLLNMPALDSDTLAHAPLVTDVAEGNYSLFIRTDLLDQIPETDETNNTAVSAGQVYVKVKELVLTVVENNTLATDQRFYKLIVPDSLNGATISVKLTTGDSLTRVNQMFIGKGYVPTAAHFDYTYPTANYGNQDIVMAYTTAGTYYIMIRAINPGTVVQNINLLAKKLPFEITSVHTNSGGNIGNVTIKINGALFTPGMIAKLNKPGTEIIASAVYFTNTTLVYATFNLQGKPLGIYDVILSKADTAFAVLVNGFSVVPANNGGLITGGGNNTGSGNGNAPGCDPGAASGLNSQLVIELLVPQYVMRGWPFNIQINYNNPTNYDIPAQVRTLYAEDIIKIAFTKEALENNGGVQSLTMELTEQGGPPGIIRAGGSGTIFIYGKSKNNVQPHTITLFRLQ